MVNLHTQFHGYKSGHQLLSSTIKLDRIDQDLIDRLSDIAGPLRPGEVFEPYLTGYPLPSEKYYVLAHTVQDLEAPRAGCVKTKSFLIPMEFWKTLADPGYLNFLIETNSDEITTSFEIEKFSKMELAPVSATGLNELVEVLFLEKRSPVVMFDVLDARLIALRLLTALWPGMRSQFSVCTFALSPRYIAEKPFDLIFSIKQSRSRFADWEGRKIDSSNKTTNDRHRWTKHIVDSIFQHNRPELLDTDTTIQLRLQDEKSESALRLSLMWAELDFKASEGVTTAVLGMLDIANSRSNLDYSWPKLKKLIIKSLQGSLTPETGISWQLLEALLTKIRPENLDPQIEEALNVAVRRLTLVDWRSALNFLVSRDLNHRAPSSLYVTLADTLLDHFPPGFTEALLLLPTDKLLIVISVETEFLQFLFPSKSAVQYPVDRNAKLLDVIEHIPTNERFDLFRGYFRTVTGEENIPLLHEILRFAFPYQFIEAANEIWIVNKVRIKSIGDFLVKISRKLSASTELRNLFASSDVDLLTLGCIDSLLEDNYLDVQWILNAKNLQKSRSYLLNSLISKARSGRLHVTFNSAQQLNASIALLIENANEYPDSLAKLLVLLNEVKPQQIKLVCDIYPLLKESRQEIAFWLLSRLPDVMSYKEVNAERLIKIIIDELSIESVVNALFSTSLSGEQVSRNLNLLANSKATFRDNILESLTELVDLFVYRSRLDLTLEGAKILGGLITSIKEGNHHTYMILCARLLPFSLSGKEGPSSELLKVVFPPIYNALSESHDIFNIVSGFIFEDWDKCKTLRRDLVKSFIHSARPPIDFVLIALLCKDSKRFLSRLRKEPKGVEYLESILKNLDSLNVKSMKQIQKFLKDKAIDIWDEY